MCAVSPIPGKMKPTEMMTTTIATMTTMAIVKCPSFISFEMVKNYLQIHNMFKLISIIRTWAFKAYKVPALSTVEYKTYLLLGGRVMKYVIYPPQFSNDRSKTQCISNAQCGSNSLHILSD